MSGSKCHCSKPATWFVRVVPTREVRLVEGNLPEVVLAVQSVDLWASCDAHVAEAARGLIERRLAEGKDMDDVVLVLRPERE